MRIDFHNAAPPQLTPADAAAVPAEAKTAADGSLKVTFAGPSGVEEPAEVPESALRRDDALGALVDKVFDLLPPEMPALD